MIISKSIIARLIITIFYAGLSFSCAGGIYISAMDSSEQWSEIGGGPLHTYARTDEYDGELSLLFILRPRSMVGTTIVTGDNTVFSCSQKGMLQAFDLTRGKEIGLIKIKNGMISAPVYDDHTLYFGAIDGRYTINAYNPVMGRFIWRKNLGIFESPFTVSGGRLYAANRSGTVYAIDKESGEVEWSFQADSEVFAGLIVLEDLVYIGSLQGTITALDAATGDKKWEKATGLKLRATPSSDGTRLFWGSINNAMLAVDAKSGEELWRYSTNGAVYTTPSIAGDQIIFGCNDGNIHSLDAVTGSEKWRYDAGSVVNTSCITIGSRVFFGALNKKIYALDTGNGERVWEYSVQGRVVAHPAYYDGKLIFPVEHRFLYVFGKSGG